MNTTDPLMFRLTILRRFLAPMPFHRIARRSFAICLALGIGLAAALSGSVPAAAQDTTGPTRIDGDSTRDRPVKRTTVKVEELGAPGAGSTGTLTDANGGLGISLWRGAATGDVVALMAKLPPANRSFTLHDLQRRLLLTVALAPQNKSGSKTVAAAGGDFAAARLQALMRMGATRDLLDLAARIKTAPAPPFPILRARFLSGDHKGACAAVRAYDGKSRPFIEQARIACHALTGDGERAEIALRLLHEQGTPPAKGFERAVMAAVLGEAPRSLEPPYALTIALLKQGKARLKSATLLPLPIGALVSLSAASAQSRALRTEALERAVRRGAPVDSDLAILYAGANASATAIGSAASTRLRAFDTTARTHLYLAAAASDDVPKRLRILSAWWRLAAGRGAQGDDGAEMLAARLTTPFLKNIKPAATYQDHAAHIARAYFATGRIASALAWYKALKTAPFRNPADLHRITALAVLAAPTDGKTIEAWIDFRRRSNPASAPASIADLRALLEGLGRMQAFTRLWARKAPVGSEAAAGRGKGGDYPGLREAAATEQRGLTVLRVLTLIKGRSLRRVPRDLLREAVTGLRVVGLEREARQLAVEAALARQL